MINLFSKNLSIITLSMFLIACSGSGDSSSNISSSSSGSNISSSSNSTPTVTSTAVALSWVAPTNKVDGSALSLSEIAGYRIYRGSNQNNLILLTETADPSNWEYNLTETEAGIYYYAVTVYDINGLESTLSNVVSKTAT